MTLKAKIYEATALLSTKALEENFRRLGEAAGLDAKSVFALVKANAYGHGASEVAERLYRIGARRFAVARLCEAREIREVVADSEILILAPTSAELTPSLLEGDFTQSVNSLAYANELAKRVPSGSRLKIAIAVDTGMGRLGFPAVFSDPTEEILAVAANDRLYATSIYTHLPDADVEGGLAEQSVGIFRRQLNRLSERGLSLPSHFANSASILLFGKEAQPLIRPGLSLYGYNPAPHLTEPRLLPVMRLLAPVLQIREFTPGETVGYCRTYRIDAPTRVALLGIGYADGFLRTCSGATVTINGAPCRIIGRISMDLTSVAIPDGLPVAVGDAAVIFGDNQEQLLSLSEHAKTIPNELLAGITSRVKRLWV